MKTTITLLLATLLVLPLARADGPGETLDALYEEATSTLDHHYDAATARADAEADWTDGASHAAADDALAACGAAESAYADEAEANATSGAEDAQTATVDAASFAGRLARGEEEVLEENGTLDNATTELGEWLGEQLDNGTLIRDLLVADGPIRNETSRAALLAQSTLLQTAPCVVLARDPTQDGRRILLREDAPLVLRHLDGAIDHVRPGAPSVSERYAKVLRGIDRVGNETGIDPYAPLPPIDTGTVDELWREACPYLEPAWACAEGSA